MIPVDQTTFGSPDDTPPGNCTSACVASLLHLPCDDVPIFVSRPNWFEALSLFAREHGHAAVYVRGGGYDCGRHVQGEFHPGGHGWMAAKGTLCIAGGPGPRGHEHSVVWRLGEGLVHDPHPSRAGLTDEPEHYIFLLPLPKETP